MKKRNKEIITILNKIQKEDQDKSLFYAWEKIPKDIQECFIGWCERYMQVSHKDCFGGWGFGWSKYYEQYILWLKEKRKDLE